MAVKLRTESQITDLVSVSHVKSGGVLPARGSTDYYTQVGNALQQAWEASAGFLQVFADDSAGTTARVLAGRAVIAGVNLVYAGGTIALSSYNNGTAYVWLEDNSGSAQITAAADGTGWPAGNHIKLAEVTLASGAITAIVDRRPDVLISDGSQTPGTAKSAFTVGLGSATAKVAIDNNSATGDFTLKLVPENLTANRTLTLPDETGTVATEAYVDAAVPDLGAVTEEILTFEFETTTQGDTSTPSTITITCKDLDGNVLSGARNLRVRICNASGYTNATNATIDANASNTLLESITADKDLVIRSSGMTGLWYIDLTDATAETVRLRIGPPPVSGQPGDYRTFHDVAHAAP